MIEIIRKLIERIHQLIPRQNHAVIYGWPDCEDSMIALEEALQKSELGKVVILMTGIQRSPAWKIGPKTSLVRKNSLKGLWLFLRAKYVFFTHPCFVRYFPDDVVSVNIWHGMPIKRIGLMLPGSVRIQSRFILATSTFWGYVMKRATPSDTVLDECGLPRNDRLFSNREDVLRKVGVPGCKHIIVWLPTYRTSIRGELREDGREFGNSFEMPDINLSTLNEFMRTNDAVLLSKPHPMAMNVGPREWSHLKIIHDSWLTGRELTLYKMIGGSDVLITDISSVMIDFLLVDKPVIHAFPDIEEYRDSRGFSVEPIGDFFAGEVVNNQEELLKALKIELSGMDPHAKKRRAIRDLSHAHQDDQATQRLLKAINLI